MQGRAAILIAVIDSIGTLLQNQFQSCSRALLSSGVGQCATHSIAKKRAGVIKNKLEAVDIFTID